MKKKIDDSTKFFYQFFYNGLKYDVTKNDYISTYGIFNVKFMK